MKITNIYFNSREKHILSSSDTTKGHFPGLLFSVFSLVTFDENYERAIYWQSKHFTVYYDNAIEYVKTHTSRSF